MNYRLLIVMPNHIHGIVVLVSVGAGPRACPDSGPRACPDNRQTCVCSNDGQPQGVAPTMSLSDVVHRFKSLTTTHYRHGVVKSIWPPFVNRLWQRNYYEHIIRSENELNAIRQYIVNNPLKWQLDRENPLSKNYNLNQKKYFKGVYDYNKQVFK